MPKILIRGNGQPEYEYVIKCEICYSYLICQEHEFDRSETENIAGIDFPVERVYCDVCQKYTQVYDHEKHKYPKGLFASFEPNINTSQNKPSKDKPFKENPLIIKKSKNIHTILPTLEELSLNGTKRRKINY